MKKLADLEFPPPGCDEDRHCGHLDKDGHLVCCDCGKRTVEKLSDFEQMMALRIRFRNHGKFMIDEAMPGKEGGGE